MIDHPDHCEGHCVLQEVWSDVDTETHHLLGRVPYAEVPRPEVVMPPRVRNPDYHRGPIPPEMFVPALY